MQQIDVQAAYILHTRKFRESSLLIEVLTRDFGRIVVIGKGLSNNKSRSKKTNKTNLRGLLQPFQSVLISCAGRGEILNLKTVESTGQYFHLAPKRIVCGLYMNELLMRLLARHDPHPELFRQYEVTLQTLETDSKEEPVLRLFEKTLLEAIGYRLPLTEEAFTGRPVLAEKLYDFDPELGPIGVLAADETARKGKISGKSLLALAKGELEEDSVLLEVKHLMRKALARHLGEKPLESRRLLTH